KTLPTWKQQETGRKQNFDKMGDFRNQQRSERRCDKFTLLTKSPKEILALDKGKFKTLPPMTTLTNRRTNQGWKGPDENNKEGEASGKDKAMVILMVQPWQRVARQRVTQSLSLDSKISFPPLRDEDGTEGPMIIEAEIGGRFIHCISVGVTS
ncbi:hypothetical protein Tco_0297783, partial [Tanacetum coccineum]